MREWRRTLNAFTRENLPIYKFKLCIWSMLAGEICRKLCWCSRNWSSLLMSSLRVMSGRWLRLACQSIGKRKSLPMVMWWRKILAVALWSTCPRREIKRLSTPNRMIRRTRGRCLIRSDGFPSGKEASIRRWRRDSVSISKARRETLKSRRTSRSSLNNRLRTWKSQRQPPATKTKKERESDRLFLSVMH